MYKYLLLLAVPVLSLQVHAQSSGNPLSAGAKGMYQMLKNNVLKAAQEMPESDYAFKPVDSVRSFGQLVAHIGDAQYEFCSPVVGDGTKHTMP